jgi:hypothetical protein
LKRRAIFNHPSGMMPAACLRYALAYSRKGLSARSKNVAALYERRSNCSFWPDFSGHRPPLQPHLECLTGQLGRPWRVYVSGCSLPASPETPC